MASDDLSRERAIRAEAIKAAMLSEYSKDSVAHAIAHWIQTGERQYLLHMEGYGHEWCKLGDKCWYWKTGEAR